MLTQAEWRITIGHQQEYVGSHSQPPATDPDYEVEEGPRVLTSHQNGEPGQDHGEESGHPEKKQDDVVRDNEQPLDEG